MIHKVIQGDCEVILDNLKDFKFFRGIHLTFLDPPFNQGKEYNRHDDNMREEDYWNWLKRVIKKIFTLTVDGGAIYFMQREKNSEYVLQTLRETGWTFQNLIIWNKLTSAIPSKIRYGKRYQIIAFHTKGTKPLIFNNLRYEPPLLATHEYERETGMYITDIWEDIRELTSGYLAGGEAIRVKNNKYFTKEGERFHKQQSPVELLTRIILSSSKPGDFILDPFAGTGVTTIVAKQLKRNSISIELDPLNVKIINKRLELMRKDDNIDKFYSDYIYSENIDTIWNDEISSINSEKQNYFFKDIPKNKINNVLLMKDTIKSILINELNISEEKVKLDYRLKDVNDKIHRFELAILLNKKSKIILRLIYAKSVDQAKFWANRINFENDIVKKKEPKSFYYAIISGIAFKNILIDMKNEINSNILISFPGWEPIYNCPSFIEKMNSLDILDKIKIKGEIKKSLYDFV